MEIKIQKLVTDNVEITLPFFCKDGVCHYYKIYSEEECLQLTNMTSLYGTNISVCHSGLAFNSQGSDLWKEITEEEFNEARIKLTSRLIEL